MSDHNKLRNQRMMCKRIEPRRGKPPANQKNSSRQNSSGGKNNTNHITPSTSATTMGKVVQRRRTRKTSKGKMDPQRPTLNRDILIELGSQAIVTNKFITLNTLRVLFLDTVIRQSALRRLSKFQYLLIDRGYAQLSESIPSEKKGESLFIKLDDNLTGVKIFNFLIETVMSCFKTFFTHVYIVSMSNVPSRNVLNALKRLRGVTHITFPTVYGTFSGHHRRGYESLLHINADTLEVVKHVTSIDVIPCQMHNKIAVITHSPLRYCDKADEHFFAFFQRNQKSTHVQEVENGVVLKMDVLNIQDFFKESKGFVSEIVTQLRLRVIFFGAPTSIANILEEIEEFKDALPHLEHVNLHIDIMDWDPRQLNSSLIWFESDEFELLPESTDTVDKIALECVNWLRPRSLPFSLNLRVLLSIDYNCSSNDDAKETKQSAKQGVSAAIRNFTLKPNPDKRKSAPHPGDPDLIANVKLDERTHVQLAFICNTLHYSMARVGNHDSCDNPILSDENYFL